MRILPGLLAAAAVTVVAVLLASLFGAARVSPVTLAIVLGLAIGAVAGPRPELRAGTAFAVKRLLRIGIILVGIRLSLLDVLQLGAIGIPFVATIVVSAMLLARFAARRLGVSEKFGLLTAAATSICGVTAALATGPAIDAEEREVAYAVANTTLFGLMAMLLYPWVARAVFGAGSVGAGLFLGTSIHDTSQVVGAALSYRQMFGDELAFKAATVTKLTRNLFLVAVVPLLGWLAHRRAAHAPEARRPSLASLVPLFVLGFVAMALARTLGDLTLARTGAAFGILDAAMWQNLTRLLGDTVSGWLLATAMAGVGLSIDFRMFRQLGARPLALGALVAIAVGALGMVLATLVAPWVTIG
ncbi:MAG: YeiH family protein [Thermoanaerobaculia bacterium]